MKKSNLLVVIVTYNSQDYITWALAPLLDNDLCHVRIFDSGSSDPSYLSEFEKCGNVEVIYGSNVGFAKANNLSLNNINDFDYVLFLNPDARIESEQLGELLLRADKKENKNIGIFSVGLEKYSINVKRSLAFYDSLGIYCDLIGRWKDIQCPVSTVSDIKYDAICGAFMLCRAKALASSPDSRGNIGFEESFFMYKEDIELSLRIKKHWGIKIFFDLTAYHCRGWGGARSSNPYWARKLSAENDLRVALRYKLRALPYAMLKYIYVIMFERK